MDHNHLFLEKLTDLETKASAQDEYSVLMGAAPLRHLLLDEMPLVHLVNRPFHLSIRYVIATGSPLDAAILQYLPSTPTTPAGTTVGAPSAFWIAPDGLDPTTSPGGVPREVTHDQLLAEMLMHVQGRQITVKDLIRHVAHIGGGIHSHDAKSHEELFLQEVANQFSINGLPSMVYLMRSIARVVVSGLAPLREAVMLKEAGKQ